MSIMKSNYLLQNWTSAPLRACVPRSGRREQFLIQEPRKCIHKFFWPKGSLQSPAASAKTQSHRILWSVFHISPWDMKAKHEINNADLKNIFLAIKLKKKKSKKLHSQQINRLKKGLIT